MIAWILRLFGRAPTPRAWQRRSVVALAQVDPTPVLCGASIVQALRRAALLAVLPVLAVSCGEVALGGDYDDPAHQVSTLTHEDLDRVLALAIELGNGTSDSRLHGRDPSVLNGWTVYTMSTHVWTLDDGRKVSGWASCPTREMVIGTPPSGVWENSSLVHELFHVFQGCHGSAVVDPECDESHGNWARDGLFRAIIAGRVLR